jgi:hypothetical protein
MAGRLVSVLNLHPHHQTQDQAMNAIDMSGSAFCAYPIESEHAFRESHDGFNCLVCARPRALHRNDGFVANSDRSAICMKRGIRFGKHKYFYPLGKLRHEIEDEKRKKREPFTFFDYLTA